ncbi:hypothetical protein [Niveispirillum irakense]|uniref:hypothetical protein n=1 Tax=Niveispirillum irakense TaxID=34011 RepID=UPI000417B8F2|nr:hypothetical protein [Niveispirillum irakense]
MNKGIMVAIAVIVGAVIIGLVYGMTKGGGNDVATIRSNMIKSSTAECNRSTRAAIPQSVPDARIEKYCTCSSDRLFASLTDEEILQLAEAERTGNTELANQMVARSMPILEACRAEADLQG